CRCATLWLTLLFVATKVPSAPRPFWTARERRRAAVKSGATSASGSSSKVATCARGTRRTCPSKTGRVSRKATPASSCNTRGAGRAGVAAARAADPRAPQHQRDVGVVRVRRPVREPLLAGRVAGAQQQEELAGALGDVAAREGPRRAPRFDIVAREDGLDAVDREQLLARARELRRVGGCSRRDADAGREQRRELQPRAHERLAHRTPPHAQRRRTVRD